MKFSKYPGLLLILFSFLSNNSDAIIIRHDRDDTRYRALASKYPQACLVGRDVGTLIAPQWVLTAAHVAQSKRKDTSKIKIENREYSIEQIYLHPDWRDGEAHDIALIKLASPVLNIEPAHLYTDHDEAGKQVVFVGFGGFGNGLTGPTTDDGIKRAATNKVDSVDADWLRFTFNDPATATDLEGISGPGDSGGPAFIERDGKLFVAGVSVFGEPGRQGRGTYGAKEAYTRVSQHIDWLSKTVTTAANRPMAQSTDSIKLPDTPAAKRLAEVLAAIEMDDGAKVRAFIKTFSKAFLEAIPEADHLDFFEQVHDRQGGLDVVRIDKSTPYSIVVIARGKKTGALRKIAVDVEPAAPNAIAMLGFQSADGAGGPVGPVGQPGGTTIQPIRLLGADEMNRKLDDFLTRLSAYGFSGSALVAKDDKALFSKSYGLADRARNIKNTPDTLFDIGSVAKQFTSAAVLKLEMMGKLNTSDPITKFFDNVPDDKKGITILQMLSMTSGLVPTPGPDGTDAMRDREKRVRQILNSPLSFAPGARYQYSNSGYNMAAAIVEKVSGQPFDQFLYEQLLKPAGMTNTGFKMSAFRVPDWDKKAVVHLYNGDDDNGPAGDKDDAAWFLNGPGGFLTTPGDLLKWHLALLGDKILSDQAKQKLYTPVMNDYALGWRVTTGPFGKVIEHNGGTTVGAGAHFMRFIDRGVTIIFCVNNAGEDFIEPVSNALTRLVFGGEAPMPPLVVSLPSGTAAKLTGNYKTEAGGSLSVTAAGNGIKVSANDPAGLRALYGASDRQTERYKTFEARTLAIVEGSMKGDYAALHEAFGRRMPIERLAEMEKRMLNNQSGRFGAYKSFAVIGSTPESQGDVGVVVRFDFERGSFYRQYTWVPRGLDGVRPLSGPPSLSFVPVSPTEFASYDITSGDIARVKFEISASGAPSGVLIERRSGSTKAAKQM